MKETMRRLTSILMLLTAVMTVQAEDTPLIGNVLNRQTPRSMVTGTTSSTCRSAATTATVVRN